MRICIFGAGAVGSHFAVRLALSGHQVSCVMRGPHLEATKANGLTLRVGDKAFKATVRASDDPAALGPQDVVISTLKATGVTSLATGLSPLLRDVIPRLLDEANAVGQSCCPAVKRVIRGGPAPEHKPSILQDYELGRALEIDALVRAPAAFARTAGLPTPMLDMLAGLAIQKARDKGLYQADWLA